MLLPVIVLLITIYNSIFNVITPNDKTPKMEIRLRRQPHFVNSKPLAPLPSNRITLDPLSAQHLLRALNYADQGHNAICTQQLVSNRKRYALLSTLYQRYFITANIHQNSPILPNFILQLLELIQSIGDPSRVFVSIYESGSSDETRMYLELLRMLLRNINVPYAIVFESESVIDGVYGERKFDKSSHRIDFLAWVRNQALKPLIDNTSGMKFDRIVFLNDVYFCASDILELIYQSALNNASLTCGLDYDSLNGQLGFYDTCKSIYQLNKVIKVPYRGRSRFIRPKV
jgi:hypothetical protein